MKRIHDPSPWREIANAKNHEFLAGLYPLVLQPVHDFRMQSAQNKLTVADNPVALESVRRMPDSTAGLLQNRELQCTCRYVKGGYFRKVVTALSCTDEILEDRNVGLETLIDEPFEGTNLTRLYYAMCN